MKRTRLAPPQLLYLAASATSVLGLVASWVIYRSAVQVPQDDLLDQLEDSKAYLRTLEMYGGKANVLAAEFSRWFDSLWHGRSLAITTGIIAIFLSFMLCFAACYLYDEETDETSPARTPREDADSRS